MSNGRVCHPWPDLSSARPEHNGLGITGQERSVAPVSAGEGILVKGLVSSVLVIEVILLCTIIRSERESALSVAAARGGVRVCVQSRLNLKRRYFFTDLLHC